MLRQSFVRGPSDVQALRKSLHDLQSNTPIIAKIETPQAIETLDAIIAEGRRVARRRAVTSGLKWTFGAFRC